MNTIQKVLLAINIFIVILYLLSAYIGYANPNNTSYLSLLSMGYPFLLAILPITLLFWLFYKRVFLSITLVAIAATIPQILTFIPFSISDFEREDYDKRFILMTYNIQGFARNNTTDSKEHPTINDILKYHPDFVCLQECNDNKVDGKKEMTNDQIIALRSSYPYYYESPNMKLTGFYSKKPTEVILSKFINPYFNVDVYKTTALGKDAYILNTHLESIGLTRSDKDLYMDLTDKDNNNKTLRGVRSQLLSKLISASKKRAEQADIIHHICDSICASNPDALFFVCGDFNDPPYTYSFLKIRGDMTDVYREEGSGYAYSYNQNRFYFRIDNIFYKSDIVDAKAVVIGKSKASDHHLMTAIFKDKE